VKRYLEAKAKYAERQTPSETRGNAALSREAAQKDLELEGFRADLANGQFQFVMDVEVARAMLEGDAEARERFLMALKIAVVYFDERQV
jgi:hypothetical protein